MPALTPAEAIMMSAFEAAGLSERARLERIGEALRAGCDPNCQLASAPGYPHPPLERACWAGSLPMALCLIERGARAGGSGALLAWAACGGEPASSLLILELLLANGAQINERSDTGETPLLIALGSKLSKKAIWLAQRGARVNASDGDGYYPLHFCAQLDMPEAVPALARAGSPIEARCSDGETPLLMAARFGSAGACAALIQEGADFLAVNPQGDTPLDMAARRGHQACFATLHSAFERAALQEASRAFEPPEKIEETEGSGDSSKGSGGSRRL